MSLHFIAITAPAEVEQRVLQYKHYMRERYGCMVALRSPAHITLIPPFRLADADGEFIRSTLLDFAAGCRDVSIELRNFAAFPPRVIYIDVVRNQPLQRVQAALEALLVRAFPIKKSSFPFHPHVTIANRDLEKQDFQEAWDHFKAESFEAMFAASGISLLKYTGSVWETVYKASFTAGSDNGSEIRFSA